MSTSDVRYPAGGDKTGPSPPVITPQYGASLPNPPSDMGTGRRTKCATGIRFIKTVHGILNIVILVAIVCVLISAGVVDNSECQAANFWSSSISTAKVNAVETRNAVIVFAVFGLILILLDTILYMTGLILRLPPLFDLIFNVVMLVLAGIYLILGCCAAAWEQKMRDTVGSLGQWHHRGAAASAAFFLFVAMIAIIADYVLRLVGRPAQPNFQ